MSPAGKDVFVVTHDASAEPPTWWWNPLAAVHGLGDAEQLATIWADVGKPKDAREDAYFEPRGRTLLAAMILAGAVGNNPLTDVASWLKNPFDTKPSNILRTTYPAVADTIDSERTLPEKTRAGVYDTALKAVGWLDNPSLGKSSLVRRQALGLAALEIQPAALGDHERE